MTPRVALTLAALCLLASGAQAHRTWLLPTQAFVHGPKPVVVTVDACASEHLFEHELPLPIGTLTLTRPDGRAQPLPADSVVLGPRRNRVDVRLDAPGTWRLSHANAFATLSYQLGSETRRWRGPVAELAAQVPAAAHGVQAVEVWMRQETFLGFERASVPPPEATAAAASALTVELLDPPTDLSSGDTLRLRVHFNGRPLAGVRATLSQGGARYRYKLGDQTLQADGEGVLHLRWDEPGRWWLSIAHDVGPAGGGPLEAPLRRHRYSATFEVLPR